MSSGFQTPIKIKDVIDKIHNRQYLLPAIQRKFTWSSEQIEMLFDSIMRGYPINSFMMWKIKDAEIKSGYKFYEFLTEYREFFKENNNDIDTSGTPDFEAIIDGQQRLTSLYLGLRGSYAYRMPRKWLKDNEDCLPTRRLYLNLCKPVNQQYDNQKMFDFRFLSDLDIAKYRENVNEYWFRVGEILDLDSSKKMSQYLDDNRLKDNEYAYEALSKLYESVHVQPLINYYLQEEQEPDKVLEIFIRTNSGGTPLSFSDLLMSIASANWKRIDARKEIELLVSEVYAIGRPGFIIDKDFVLKTCLVLFVDNIKFQLKNFTFDNVQIFENNWVEIKKSIIAAFTLFEKLGFNNTIFRAKNAAIPVIYYIYYHDLADKITKVNYDKDDRLAISKWLSLSFIKSIFGGQPDTVLVRMRKVLHDTASTNKFPVQELMDAFKSDPSRNYSFDDDYLDGLLESQKDSNEAFYVLRMLYPNLDYYNQDFHQDHLHPATIFKDDTKFAASIPKEDADFARNPKIWNGIANLQLLNGRLNSAKKDTSLSKWVQDNNITHTDLFLPNNTSLEIKDFANFIKDRKATIKEALKKLVL